MMLTHYAHVMEDWNLSATVTHYPCRPHCIPPCQPAAILATVSTTYMRMFYQDGYIVPLKLYMIGMDNKLRFLKEFGS